MRGGRREGAGRKRVLDEWERLAVGGRCEEVWREMSEDARLKHVSARTTHVQAVWDEARAIPVSERRKWIKSHAFRDYLEDVEFALQSDDGISPPENEAGEVEPGIEIRADRLLDVTVPRLKGYRQDIIDRIAADETRLRGHDVSSNLVKLCWKEFRSAEAEARQGLEADQGEASQSEDNL